MMCSHRLLWQGGHYELGLLVRGRRIKRKKYAIALGRAFGLACGHVHDRIGTLDALAGTGTSLDEPVSYMSEPFGCTLWPRRYEIRLQLTCEDSMPEHEVRQAMRQTLQGIERSLWPVVSYHRPWAGMDTLHERIDSGVSAYIVEQYLRDPTTAPTARQQLLQRLWPVPVIGSVVALLMTLRLVRRRLVRAYMRQTGRHA